MGANGGLLRKGPVPDPHGRDPCPPYPRAFRSLLCPPSSPAARVVTRAYKDRTITTKGEPARPLLALLSALQSATPTSVNIDAQLGKGGALRSTGPINETNLNAGDDDSCFRVPTFSCQNFLQAYPPMTDSPLPVSSFRLGPARRPPPSPSGATAPPYTPAGNGGKPKQQTGGGGGSLMFQHHQAGGGQPFICAAKFLENSINSCFR